MTKEQQKQKGGRRIGYARVSTADQDLSVQREALEKAACNVVMEEKRSGRTRDREQLTLALKLLGRGDTLVCTRLDRLGRSMRDLANVVHEIEVAGASLQVLEQSVDTSTSAGRAFVGMLATFAQFEADVRAERQAEGIAKAKREDAKLPPHERRYRGRKPSASRARIRELVAQGIGPSAIAKQLGIHRATVHRMLCADAT